MQSDFSMLVVSDSDDPAVIHAEAPCLTSRIDSVDFDMEAMMTKYPNISEEALIFLARFQGTTANTTSPVRAKPALDDVYISSVIGPIPVSFLALPPPKRFKRVSKCPHQ